MVALGPDRHSLRRLPCRSELYFFGQNFPRFAGSRPGIGSDGWYGDAGSFTPKRRLACQTHRPTGARDGVTTVAALARAGAAKEYITSQHRPTDWLASQ